MQLVLTERQQQISRRADDMKIRYLILALLLVFTFSRLESSRSHAAEPAPAPVIATGDFPVFVDGAAANPPDWPANLSRTQR